MKKALSGILAALVLLSSLPTAMTASALPSDSDVEDRNVAHTVYVSTTGNDDTGDGSQGKPFATIEKAKEHVRTLDKDSGDIVVKIAGGLYELEDTIVFDENDSGMSKRNVRRFANTVTADCEAGARYRVVVTIFAENSAGRDSRTQTFYLNGKA